MDRQKLGATAEQAAVDFLQSQGLSIVLRNCRYRFGELDVVARDGDTLAIVEVRSRTSNRFGGAAASVDIRKQARLKRAAALLLQQRKELSTLRVRFDVVAVRAAKMEWIKHAFT